MLTTYYDVKINTVNQNVQPSFKVFIFIFCLKFFILFIQPYPTFTIHSNSTDYFCKICDLQVMPGYYINHKLKSDVTALSVTLEYIILFGGIDESNDILTCDQAIDSNKLWNYHSLF